MSEQEGVGFSGAQATERKRPSHPTWGDGLKATARTLASNLSGSAEADGDLAILDDDRNVPNALGEFKHLLQGFLIFLHIDIANRDFSLGAVLPGRHGKGSPILAIDYDFGCHGITSL